MIKHQEKFKHQKLDQEPMWILQAGDFLCAYLFAPGIIPVYIAGKQFLSQILPWNQATRAPNDGWVPWKPTQWIHLDTPTARWVYKKNINQCLSLKNGLSWPFCSISLGSLLGPQIDPSSLTPISLHHSSLMWAQGRGRRQGAATTEVRGIHSTRAATADRFVDVGFLVDWLAQLGLVCLLGWRVLFVHVCSVVCGRHSCYWK